MKTRECSKDGYLFHSGGLDDAAKNNVICGMQNLKCHNVCGSMLCQFQL